MERILGCKDVKETTITLSERELFLIKWSLDLMRFNIKGSNLKYDVESIRDKLSSRIFIPDIDKN